MQDLVIPPMCSPQKYAKSPILGAPARERTILGFFKGRIQPNNPRYSRGTRQFLAKHSGMLWFWVVGRAYSVACKTGLCMQHIAPSL